MAQKFLIDLETKYIGGSKNSKFYNFPSWPSAVNEHPAAGVERDAVAKPSGKYKVLGRGSRTSTRSIPAGLGNTNAAIDEIFNKFMIPQMFAEVAQGKRTPEEAAKVYDRSFRGIFQRWRNRGKTEAALITELGRPPICGRGARPRRGRAPGPRRTAEPARPCGGGGAALTAAIRRGPHVPGRECVGREPGRRANRLVAQRSASAWVATAGWRSGLAPGADGRRGAGWEPTLLMAGALGIAGLAGWLPLAWRAPVREGDRVLVLGATGTAGQVAVQAAKLLGAAHVVAAGRDPAGLERALDARRGRRGRPRR